MPFVQGKCENCAGILTVDTSQKAAICPFCGAAYVVQDSINYYNTTIKVESMHANVVNITDESSSEARLKAGAAYLKIGKFDLAETEYLSVTKLAPQNHLGWLGLIEARTSNYTKRIKSASELKTLDSYSNSVITLASDGSGNVLIEKWKNYLNSEEAKNASEKEVLSQELTEQTNQLNALTDESMSMELQKANKEKRLSFLNNTYHVDDTRNVKWPAGLLGVGIPLVLMGLLSFNMWSMKDDPALPTIKTITIVLLLLGGGAIAGGITGKISHKKYINEASRLKMDIGNLRVNLGIKNQHIESIRLGVASLQQRLNEYY